MTNNKKPDLSIIMITPDSYETIRKTIAYLCQQTINNHIELIIVAPGHIHISVDRTQLKPLFNYQVIEIEKLDSLGSAKAAGIQAANASVISFIEEHVYPDAGWAEALVKAHQSHWAVVGPVVRNANPDNLISWGDFLITYGQWMEPQKAGTATILPGNNSSYKRDILLTYGDKLAAMLEVEGILHQHLIQNHHQIYLDPNAIIYHLGFSKLIPSLPVQFHIGRLFAADRSKGWPLIKKMIYSGGSPIIPAIKLIRFTKKLIQSGKQRQCPYAALPWTLPGLIYSAFGEMLGYISGPGDSIQKMIKHEFHRVQHL